MDRRTRTNCGHSFCAVCIRQVVGPHRTGPNLGPCPICRQEIGALTEMGAPDSRCPVAITGHTGRGRCVRYSVEWSDGAVTQETARAAKELAEGLLFRRYLKGKHARAQARSKARSTNQ
jgi:hypothetical protein